MTTQSIPHTEAVLDLPPIPEPHQMRGRQLGRFVRQVQGQDQLEALGSLPGDSGIVSLRVLGPSVVFLRDPEHVRHVLVTNQDNYVKNNAYRILAVLLGRGLLTNFDREDWQRQRRLVQPLFAKRHLAPMAEHMTAATEDFVARMAPLAEGTPTIDVNDAMMELTLDVVCRALFGTATDNALRQTVGDAMDTLLAAAQANLRVGGTYEVIARTPGISFDALLRLRQVHWRRAQRAKAVLDGVVHGLIDRRVQHPDPEASDLLSLLLSARDEEEGGDGRAMDRERVRDEVMTFLGAGHETTANALTWLWYTLSQYPEARRRMEAEVDEVLQGRTPTFEDVDRLPWTNACLQEAMRLHPPVPAFTRAAIASDEVGGVHIPRGSTVVTSPYLLHRNPRLWENPEGFDPERFMPGATGPARPRLAFMPFGAGRRICVGQGFALMEGVLLAAMLTQHLRFDLAPAARIQGDVAITLRPRDGMPMVMRPRHAAATLTPAAA